MISQSSTAASAPSSRSSTPVGDADAHRRLLHTLFIELFQTEQSADVHSRREADRLGETPPAMALRAVADHAKASLVEITELAKRRGFSDTRGGKVVGSLFSNVRDLLVDRLVDRERSYRGTLLGMRHGLDLVRSTAFAAEAAGDTALAIALTTWLLVRGPLVDQVAVELAWFAGNPERALEGGKGSLGASLASALHLPGGRSYARRP